MNQLNFIKFINELSKELNITPEQLEQAIRRAMINQNVDTIEICLDRHALTGEIKYYSSLWKNAKDINEISKRRQLQSVVENLLNQKSGEL